MEEKEELQACLDERDEQEQPHLFLAGQVGHQAPRGREGAMPGGGCLHVQVVSLCLVPPSLPPSLPPQPSSGLVVSLALARRACAPYPYCMDSPQALKHSFDKAIFGGGHGVGDEGKAISYYDKTRNAWKSLGTYDLKNFAMALLADQVVLVGGYSEERDRYCAKLSVWSPNKRFWTEAYAPMPTPRSGASAVGFGERLVVAGGFNKMGVLGVVEVMDAARNLQWSTVEPLPLPLCRTQSGLYSCPAPGPGLPGTEGPEALWYLVGDRANLQGRRAAFCVSLRQLVGGVGRGRRSWVELKEPPYSCSGVAVVRGFLLTVGGKDVHNAARSEIHLYLPGTNEWLLVGRLPVSARHSCACASLSDTSFLMVGGRDGLERTTSVDLFTARPDT